MKCSKCTWLNSETAHFCVECGGELSAAPVFANAGAVPNQPNILTSSINDDEITGHNSRVTKSVDPMIGQVIDRKYRLESKIGVGGMGGVYRATRLLINDQVAIKILHAAQVTGAQAAEGFQREAQAAARLKHPNAVAIYDFGITGDGLVYLVMELLEGRTLRQIITEQGSLSPATVSEITTQVCAALQAAHQHEVVHRDLKPDNIMVDFTSAGLRVKVLDFGIAKLRDLAASNLTVMGLVMGTPHYMSPEQCLGEEIDNRSDLYSLGVVIYQMLTGVLPFKPSTSNAVLIQHVNKEPPSLHDINPNISRPVEAVVLKALAKQRDDRPQTAALLARDFANAVSNTTPQAVAAVTQAEVIALSRQQQLATMVMKPAIASGGHLSLGQDHDSPRASRVLSLTTITIIAVTLIFTSSTAVYLVFFTFSGKKEILAAIKAGNFVLPEGSSAYDFYLKYKGQHLSAKDKDAIASEVLTKLEQRGEQIIANLKEGQTESEPEWNEASRAYSWLNELRPNPVYEAKLYFAQASSDFARNDYDKAITGYQRANRLQPNWALVLNRIGRCYLNRNEKRTAREFYRQATLAEPNWIMPWLNLGQLLVATREPGAAEDAFRRAIAIDSTRGPAHYGLAQALENQGKGCEALDEYRTTLQVIAAKPVNTVNYNDVQRKITVLNNSLFCEVDD